LEGGPVEVTRSLWREFQLEGGRLEVARSLEGEKTRSKGYRPQQGAVEQCCISYPQSNTDTVVDLSE
jgi:hypothetical protein